MNEKPEIALIKIRETFSKLRLNYLNFRIVINSRINKKKIFCFILL